MGRRVFVPSPCPWCGSPGVVKRLGAKEQATYYVTCSNDDGCQTHKVYESEEEAVKAWNERRG